MGLCASDAQSPGELSAAAAYPLRVEPKKPVHIQMVFIQTGISAKNLQTKFDKAIVSRILKTYPVIWAIAASCLAAPSMSSYTGFWGGEMLEQNRQNAYAEGAGTARA